MGGIVAEVLIGILYLAIVYMLVRPASPAASLIQSLALLLKNLVLATTDNYVNP